jgi:hypothetical protein
MFSFTARSTRRVRIISAAVAAGAMVVAFGMTAASASAVMFGGPVSVTAPVIAGYTTVGSTAVENNTLTVSDGTWSDGTDSDPLTYTYAWLDGNGNELGEGNTYTIVTGDIGKTIHAEVTATDTDEESSSADSASSTAVIASEVSNTTAPALTGSVAPNGTLTVTTGAWTGSGLFTYTYDWGYTSGQSGGQVTPPDATNTHVISADEFGYYLVVNVTATDANGHSAAAQETTATVVTPAAPFATDAGLTGANEGGVTGTQSKTDATVVLPAPAAEDDVVFVYGYSTPTALGFFTVSAAHTITVPLGALPKGLHKLAEINSSGVLIGWLSVTAGGGLASTGVPVNVPLELGGAGLLILLGLFSVIYVTRRSRTNANA